MHETSPTSDDLEKNHRRLPWLALGGIALVLLVPLIWLVGFYDIPKPDDSRMIPQWSERDPTTNPLIVFCDEIQRSAAKKYSDLPRDMTARLDAGDVQPAREFLAKQSDTLAAFDKIRHTDSTTWLWPDGEAMTSPHYAADYLSTCNVVVKVVLLKAKLLAREGKEDEAMRLCLDVAKLGAGMQRAEGCPVHLMVANGIQAMGENHCITLATSQTFTRSQILQTLRELSTMEGPRREDLSFAMQADYQMFLHYLELFEQAKGTSGITGAPKRMPKFLLKRHRTINMRLDRDLPIREGLDRGWREGLKAGLLADAAFEELAAKRRSIGFFLDSNFVGKICIVLCSTPMRATFRSNMNACAAQEQRRVLLALRLYEMDQGGLPASLEALVPTYLPEMPEDIYSGKPMLWNANDKVVYSTGENGIDDGGRINEAQPRKGLDVGRAYPWANAPLTSPAHE
ncbi:hypothetical protein DES53_10393 [Roseimicrobium gellanilyticum]|uniref:Uncharacterized protein n=1 Tax=Roseimicrobium gellanilyticum TaxID=748857 RepID=A0A366HNN0_9BACT|nr:hypothetical protein [Roseimicrobium gellanilyticum]RBP45097.1 hypothetical protein DES53_10393 [Roseimicrobium gellanilyticum]